MPGDCGIERLQTVPASFEQAKRDLSDPLLAHLGITAIGYDVGFKDAAHFSRAFKARFGMTPSRHRAEAYSEA